MNADNATHIVLPFFDLSSARAAMPVAVATARKLHAPLHVLAHRAQLAEAQNLIQAIPPPAMDDPPAIETVSDDLLGATLQKADETPRSIVILALRLHGDEPKDGLKDEPNSIEAIGGRMLEKLSCPILIVPPERDMSSWRLRRELLPQDGTPGCACALEQIIQRSSQLGIESLVLRVAGANVGQPTEPGSLATPRYVDHPQYEWESWGQEFLERVHGMGDNPGAAGIRLLMANGEPVAEILRIAREKDVDMIILPWHRVLRSGRARMVKAVLQQASCPVLLVPQPGNRRKHPR